MSEQLLRQVEPKETLLLVCLKSISKFNFGFLLFYFFTIMDSQTYFSLVFFWTYIQIFVSISGQPALLKNLLSNKELDSLNTTVLSVVAYFCWIFTMYLANPDTSYLMLILSILVAPLIAHKISIYSMVLKKKPDELIFVLFGTILIAISTIGLAILAKTDEYRILLFFVMVVADYPIYLFIQRKNNLYSGRTTGNSVSVKSIKIWLILVFSTNWYLMLVIFLMQILAIESAAVASVFGLSLQIRAISSVIMGALSQQLLKINSNIDVINGRSLTSIVMIAFVLLFGNLFIVGLLYLFDFSAPTYGMQWDVLILMVFTSCAINYFSLFNSVIVRVSYKRAAILAGIFFVISVISIYSGKTIVFKLIFWNVNILVFCIAVSIIEIFCQRRRNFPE